MLDLAEKKFFIALKSYYPENGPYLGMEEKFFTPKFYKIKEDPNSEIAYEFDYSLLESKPCEELADRLEGTNVLADQIQG